jgi:hypothetical protein
VSPSDPTSGHIRDRIGAWRRSWSTSVGTGELEYVSLDRPAVIDQCSGEQVAGDAQMVGGSRKDLRRGGGANADARHGRFSLPCVTQQPRLIGIDRLDRQEQAACLLAVRVLEAVEAEAWDLDGRQGAVDVMLTLRDGRKAAFEVTNLAAEGALQLAMLLAKDRKWSLPGDWFWTIEVGSLEDLRRLKGCYETIIQVCERVSQPYPYRIAWEPSAHPDLRWLVYESSSAMTGYPELLARDMTNPGAMVVPVAGSGVLDESLSGFAEALSKAFKSPHIEPHFAKLANATDADERHLFIPLHASALPFSISSELVFEDTLPPEPPPLPDSITHLWLAPESSRRVLLWSRAAGVWRNFPTKTK